MIPFALRSLARGTRRDTALVYCGRQFTGEELDTQSEAVAAKLSAAGVGDGHRVALLLGNTPQFVFCMLAVMKLRASNVLLSTHFTAQEITDAVQRTEAVSILAPYDIAPRFVNDDLMIADRQLLLQNAAGSLGMWRTANKKATADSGELTVQFTSGVSGRPKVVQRTAENLEDELEHFASRLGLGTKDSTVCPSSLSHAYGLVNGLLLPLFSGRPTILVNDWFLPNDVVDVIRRSRASVLVGVPAMYKALSEAYGPTAADVASLRICFSAGAPLSEDVFRAFRARYGVHIHQQYGSTETGVITVNMMERERSNPFAAGRPIGGREIQIVADDGSSLGSEECGEIAVRSKGSAVAYLGEPDLSAEKFRDDRYFTGDIGRVDDQGDVVLSGRRESFINVGGLKVDPVEVEHVLAKCDAVAECVVVPMVYASSGEVVRAVIVRRRDASENEIKQFCRHHLASHKVPRFVTFVDVLPRSSTGKVLTKYLPS